MLECGPSSFGCRNPFDGFTWESHNVSMFGIVTNSSCGVLDQLFALKHTTCSLGVSTMRSRSKFSVTGPGVRGAVRVVVNFANGDFHSGQGVWSGRSPKALTEILM